MPRGIPSRGAVVGVVAFAVLGVLILVTLAGGPETLILIQCPDPTLTVRLEGTGGVLELPARGRHRIEPGEYRVRCGKWEGTVTVVRGEMTPLKVGGLGWIWVTADPSLVENPPADPPVGARVVGVGIHEVEGSRVVVEEWKLTVVLARDTLERRARELMGGKDLPPEADVVTHRKYQDLLRRAGKHEELERRYKKYAAGRPDDLDARYLYAGVGGGRKELDEILARDPNHFWALLMKADYEEPAQRIALIDRALARAPSGLRPYALHAKGRVLNDQGRGDEAVRLLEEAVWNEPDEPEFREALARVYLGRNRLAEAAGQARQALKLDPTLVDARLVLAQFYRTIGEDGEARRTLEALQNLQVDDANVARQLALTYGHLGMHAEAVDLLRKLAARFPDWEVVRDQLETAEEHLRRSRPDGTPQ